MLRQIFRCASRLRDTPYFPVNSASDILKIRNLGVVAHIDAGKTTLTERMLFYSGAIPQPGNVDDGNTVMDYMKQERERGITIRAAAISFNWDGFQMNLIDTPGHVDFSGEVERSLRVMDGCVVVVDANNGIQTQTKTVWKQADKFNVPRIIFVNKMDLHAASLEVTKDHLKKKFNVIPLVLHIPYIVQDSYKGSIDVVRQQAIEFLEPFGARVNFIPLEKLSKLDKERVKAAREELLETLGSCDDEFAEKYLSGSFTEDDIDLAIRKVTIQMTAYPIYCGSALKNKGVQPVLEGIIKYLPSPAEKLPAVGILNGKAVTRSISDSKLCALAYKVINNTSKGTLVYARVYSGKIKYGEFLKNTSKKTIEKANRILRVRANEYVEVNEIGVGDIVALGGLKEVRSGDTLISKNDPEELVLAGVQMPPPVFFCRIEPENDNKQGELETILKNIHREDPSFNAKYDEESDQLFAIGQGELHLEILRDRLEIEFGLKTRLGPMQVAYRESAETGGKTYVISIDKPGQFLKLKLKLELVESNMKVEHLEDALHGDKFGDLIGTVEWNIDKVSDALSEHINQMRGSDYDESEFQPLKTIGGESKDQIIKYLEEAMQRGAIVGYPLINIKITVEDGVWSKKRTNMVAIKEAAAKGVRELVKISDPKLMEPLMNVSITIPDEMMGDLISDITSTRRGVVMSMEKSDNEMSVVNALIPLVEMLGYTSNLRNLSKGLGYYQMNFHSYEVVSEAEQEKIMNRY
ncbi:FUSA [Blepharisma stoltei]|uniref:Tr-type G domain-containing protein n=1 Tax=Blepharisma stoltei TaxID=1481888 RepID=A0AAU9JNF2_9CILI|nr:unnamed protein product [Blepharisma stoltei]